MKKLLITLLLISPFSFADWGDVYYCQMTTLSQTTLEGERADYQLEKFTFKLDKAKNAMVFGKKGYFAGKEKELETGWQPSMEVWASSDFVHLSFFKDDKFMYASMGPENTTALSADCEKF